MAFSNVKITKQANVYFGGRVTSRTIILENGDKKTLGFMLDGDYEFNTESSEIMEILGGAMDIKINGEENFSSYKAGDSFVVPANSSFSVCVKEYADYCCSYIVK